MPCYNTLRAFLAKPDDPKTKKIVWKRAQAWRDQKIYLPCGQCIGCRLERSRQWADRCLREASLHENNCFITLTYDEEHLPKNGSLNLDHFQRFMKRLRKQYGKGIRFFHCGEYGENLGRPHYHSIIFNHDFEDKKLWTIRNENKFYISENLSSLWGKGHSLIGDVTFETAAYVARYVLKKVTGKMSEEHYQSLKPEYITMSRKPGIASAWFDKYKSDVYPSDQLVTRGVPTKPPRYFDNLLDKSDPALLALLKIQREQKANKQPEWERSLNRLGIKEEVKKAEIRNLKRSYEQGDN